MKIWKVVVPVAVVLLLAGQAAAQTEEDQRMRELEAKEMAMEAREMEMEEKLRAAEERMEEAAREIAEITKERLPRVVTLKMASRWPGKVVWGRPLRILFASITVPA